MKDWRAIFIHHHGAIGVVLFILAVVFTHAPFFLFIPVPGINMDTFNYYWFAMEIYNGNLPVIDQPHDFPWGYPLFLYILKICGANILHVAFVQTVVFAVAGIFLINQFSKTIKFGGIIAALALVIFVIQPHTIRHNITLYMESLYTSGLFILAACVVCFFRRKDALSFFTVIVGVLWVMLIRPNGIAMLIIPILLIVYSYFNNINYKPFLLALFGLVVFNIVGNYFFKGSISFGDSKRIEKVLMKIEKRYEVVKTTKADVPPSSKSHTLSSMIKQYFLNVTTSKPSFYYSLQTTNYDALIVKQMNQRSDLEMFDGRATVDTFAPGLTKFIFGDFKTERFNTEKFKNVVNYESEKKNIWMYIVHISYEVYNKLRLAYLVYILFWFTLFYAFYQVFFLRSQIDFWKVILVMGVIHIVPLVLLPFIHNRFQLRYIHVSEFVIYLNAIAGTYFLFSQFCYLKFTSLIEGKKR